MNPMAWPEPDLEAPEVMPLTASPQSVLEVMRNPCAWDVDGHDALWWAKRLKERDFFDNLTDGDRMLMLAAVLESNNTWMLRLQVDIKGAVVDELSE